MSPALPCRPARRARVADAVCAGYNSHTRAPRWALRLARLRSDTALRLTSRAALAIICKSRERLHPGSGQLESECGFAVLVTTPDGRFATGADLARQSGRHQGVGRLPRRRESAAFRKGEKMIAALRRRAEQSPLRFVELDGHLRTPALRPGPANPAPSLTRAPDRRGLGAGVWCGV